MAVTSILGTFTLSNPMPAFEFLDVILIFYGFWTLVITFVKPNWYWNGKRMKDRREILGDQRTSTMYYVLGAIMLAVGLAGRLGFLG